MGTLVAFAGAMAFCLVARVAGASVITVSPADGTSAYTKIEGAKAFAALLRRPTTRSRRW